MSTLSTMTTLLETLIILMCIYLMWAAECEINVGRWHLRKEAWTCRLRLWRTP